MSLFKYIVSTIGWFSLRFFLVGWKCENRSFYETSCLPSIHWHEANVYKHVCVHWCNADVVYLFLLPHVCDTVNIQHLYHWFCSFNVLTFNMCAKQLKINLGGEHWTHTINDEIKIDNQAFSTPYTVDSPIHTWRQAIGLHKKFIVFIRLIESAHWLRVCRYQLSSHMSTRCLDAKARGRWENKIVLNSSNRFAGASQ